MSKKDASILMLAVALFAFMGVSQLTTTRIASIHPTFTEVYTSGGEITNADKIGSEAKRAITRLRSSRDTTITVDGELYHIYPISGEENGRENKHRPQLGIDG